MSVALPAVRVGEPARHESLSVFPLFVDADDGVDYRLSNEALEDQSLLVEEVNEGGSVPDLLVENKGDRRVLFLEGEELVGAKQNRILNTSVLVAAHSKTTIPVSCVEQGRWRYKSRYFGSSGSHSPSKLRRKLKSSVSKSVKEQRGHRSDQGEVWREVGALFCCIGGSSETAAMSDAFEDTQDRITAFKENLPYVSGAAGLAVAVGGKVLSIDLFDKPATCQAVWSRLLSGFVFDALEFDTLKEGENEQAAGTSDVELLLEAAGDLPWEQASAVGEGEEHRAESKRGTTPRRSHCRPRSCTAA